MVVASTTGRPAARCSANSGAASGCTIAASVSAAWLAAAWTAPRDLPLASAAAWRASAIDGRVSPTVLNKRYSRDSPGMVRVTRPAVAHRLREHLAGGTRQQRAIEIEEGSALLCLSWHCVISAGHCMRGYRQPEP